jgi:hypothetical protein
VTPNPALEVDKHLPHVVISPLIPKMPANAGADATFKFRVADKKTDAPVTGVSDLVIVIMAPTIGIRDRSRRKRVVGSTVWW